MCNLTTSPLYDETILRRFWEKVNIPSLFDCWIWTSATDRDGYGHITVNRRLKIAHRMSWELANGPIPNGLHVLHHCDNPPCVNPSHLFLGTAKDNARDRVSKGRCNHQEGEKHWKARLITENVIEIRKSVASGKSLSEMARKFNVGISTVFSIVHRETWKHVK